MDGLKEMVRSLVALILVGTALDLALPRGSMRGFVRVVLGLLVVQTVLGPVFALVRRSPDPSTVSLPTVSGQPFPAPEEVARRARALQERVQAQALAELRDRVAAEAAALARGLPGVRSASAEAVLTPPGPRGESPRVVEVRVRVVPAAPGAARESGGSAGSRSTLAGGGPPAAQGEPVTPVTPVAPVQVGPVAGGAGASPAGPPPEGDGGSQPLAEAVRAEVARGLGLKPEQVRVLLAGPAPAGTGGEEKP